MQKIKELLRPKVNEPIKTTQKVENTYDYERGEHTYGNPQVLFKNQGKFKIGKYCSIGPNVSIVLGGGHMTHWISTYPFNTFRNAGLPAPKINTDVVVGNDVWIGFGVTILGGVTIGDGAVLGARALITKDIPPYAIVGGTPAKIIRYRFESDEIEKLLETEWWNLPDEEVDEMVPLLCNSNVDEFVNEVKKRKG